MLRTSLEPPPKVRCHQPKDKLTHPPKKQASEHINIKWLFIFKISLIDLGFLCHWHYWFYFFLSSQSCFSGSWPYGDKQLMGGRVDPLRGGSNYFRPAATWLDYIWRKKNGMRQDYTLPTTNSPPLKIGRIPKGNDRLPIFQPLYFSGGQLLVFSAETGGFSRFFAAIPTEPKTKDISKWHVEPFRREPPWRPWKVWHIEATDQLWNGGFLSVCCALLKAVLWKEGENNTMCFWGFPIKFLNHKREIQILT